MRYTNALGKVRFLRWLFGFLQVMILLEPLLVIAVVIYLIADGGQNVTVPAVVWIILAGMLALGIAMFFVVGYIFRRLYSTTIDVSREGIHHLYPRPERMIRWSEVTSLRRVAYGRGQVALQLITPDKTYTLNPYLVPDSPQAPRLQMGFGKMFWVHADGSREICDLEHSYAQRIVREHAPSLLN